MYFISEVVSAIDSSKKLIEELEGFGQRGRYYIALLNWNLPFGFFGLYLYCLMSGCLDTSCILP